MQIRAEITITRVRKRLETHARQIKRCKEFSCSNIKRLMHHSIWVYHYMMTGTNRKSFAQLSFMHLRNDDQIYPHIACANETKMIYALFSDVFPVNRTGYALGSPCSAAARRSDLLTESLRLPQWEEWDYHRVLPPVLQTYIKDMDPTKQLRKPCQLNLEN